MKKTILLFVTFAILTIQNYAQTVTDIDGNVYNTVTIGTQIWMRENLKVTHLNDGAQIPNIVDSSTWSTIPFQAYCNYNNDSTVSLYYGRIYNWYCVLGPNLCPIGWHVPTNFEWTTLETYLGGDSLAGGKMKDTGIVYWQSPNIGATNTSGFKALPGGMRNQEIFSSLGLGSFWWTSSQTSSNTAYFRSISNDHANLNITNDGFNTGFSVRCICDSSASIIKENDFQNRIHIYPNPSSDKINIEVANKQDIHCTLNIYNIIGELVLERKLSNSRTEIDLSALTPGTYIIKVQNYDWSEQTTIIKE